MVCRESLQRVWIPSETKALTAAAKLFVDKRACFASLCGMSPHQHHQHHQADAVNHPPHYTGHPSGVECIRIAEHHNFCVGNAIKYLWRAGNKGDAVQDLRKAVWYIEREIARLQQTANR